MNNESAMLLGERKYYVLLSVVTKKAYIDKDGYGYLFSAKKEAEDYISVIGHDKAYIEGSSKNISQGKDVKKFYSLGMKSIRIKKREDDDFKVIPLRSSDVTRGYYNVKLEFNVTRLRETSLKKYLEAMKDCKFIVPVYIPERKKTKYPKIRYCHAVLRDKKQALVLFSMMDEFRTWNDLMKRDKKGDFFPLEISATRVMKVKKGAGVLINPLSDLLYLSDKQLEA